MFDELLDESISDGDILASQYYSARRKLPEAEYCLLVAVLEQAVDSYLATLGAQSTRRRAEFEEVSRWFYASSKSGPRGLYSLESICELLEIDAQAVRERLDSISIRSLPTRRHRIRHSLVPAQRRARYQRTLSRAYQPARP